MVTEVLRLPGAQIMTSKKLCFTSDFCHLCDIKATRTAQDSQGRQATTSPVQASSKIPEGWRFVSEPQASLMCWLVLGRDLCFGAAVFPSDQPISLFDPPCLRPEEEGERGRLYEARQIPRAQCG